MTFLSIQVVIHLARKKRLKKKARQVLSCTRKYKTLACVQTFQGN